MRCPEINGLTFDQSSIAAIKEIRRIQKLGNMLAVLIGSSVLVSIFLSKEGLEKPLLVAWNIKSMEWETWSQAMIAVDPIVRSSIKKIASEQALNHSGKEFVFWEAVMYGCAY